MTFLESRSPREKILIFIMLGLFLGFVLLQFAIKPITVAKAQAMAKEAAAQRDFDIVQNGVSQMAMSSGSAKTAKPFNRSAVIEVAKAVNITISRMQPESDGGFKVWFEDTSSPNLYAFLTRVSQDYRTKITQVAINRRDEGVSAQMTLVPLK